MKESKEKCFIIMPISTPKDFIEVYKGDKDHFDHVLDCLFIPALEKAGFEPIPPKTKGSNIIQAEIISMLSASDLVLCDMSILNPNVFFEFGIRTALDKPVALVVDNKTKNVPFDTGIINCHQYDSSLEAWKLKSEIDALADHIQITYSKEQEHNSLWKYFGIAEIGSYQSKKLSSDDKMDILMREIVSIKRELSKRQEEKIFPHVQEKNYEDMVSDSKIARLTEALKNKLVTIEGIRDEEEE